MNPWHPIDTAPADHQIDLWYPAFGRRGPCVWHPADDFYLRATWVWFSNERSGVLVSEPDLEPTHWMECPGRPDKP